MSQSTGPTVDQLKVASEWVQQLSASSDHALLARCQEWCRSDPGNLAAFQSMREIWDGFRPPGAAPALPRPPVSRARRFATAVAAAALLAAGAAMAWIEFGDRRVEHFETGIAQRRQATLPDGSQIDLAPETRATLRFSWNRREILLTQGHAYLAVAHDARRPLVVNAGGLTITAAGSAFDVRTSPTGAEVTVDEGVITVTSGATLRAGKGQRITLSGSDGRLLVAAVDLKLAESWRGGVLQFVGAPLQDVVGEVNHYVTRKIVVADALRRMRFTGTVAPAHIGEWLEAVGHVFSIEVIDGDDAIHMRRRTGYGADG